jgi:hypothetical protein
LGVDGLVGSSSPVPPLGRGGTVRSIDGAPGGGGGIDGCAAPTGDAVGGWWAGRKLTAAATNMAAGIPQFIGTPGEDSG